MREQGCPEPDESSGDRSSLERVSRRIENALERIGGPALLDNARAESERYVALFFPFDGCGAEPTERLRTRVGILVERLDRATRDHGQLG